MSQWEKHLENYTCVLHTQENVNLDFLCHDDVIVCLWKDDVIVDLDNVLTSCLNDVVFERLVVEKFEFSLFCFPTLLFSVNVSSFIALFPYNNKCLRVVFEEKFVDEKTFIHENENISMKNLSMVKGRTVLAVLLPFSLTTPELFGWE